MSSQFGTRLVLARIFKKASVVLDRAVRREHVSLPDSRDEIRSVHQSVDLDLKHSVRHKFTEPKMNKIARSPGQMWLITKKDTEKENDIYILLRLEKTTRPFAISWVVLHEEIEKRWAEDTMINDILIVDS